VTNARSKTRLAVARDEAREKMLARIEKAGNIRADEVRSDVNLADAMEKENRWWSYNSELLSCLFTTNEYQVEYCGSRQAIHYAADRYDQPPSWQTLQGRLVGSVTSQISALHSIVDRLDLIDEDEMPATDSTAQGERNLKLVIERFHLVARQMRERHSSRASLEINDEYDVQDLFHALLMIFFDDIRREEWTPSYAGGASKIDFLLLEIETAIEIKKSRNSLTTRQLGEELLIDIAKYQTHPQCRKLICFVYDTERIFTNPRGVEADLSKLHNELAVVVMIVPRP